MTRTRKLLFGVLISGALLGLPELAFRLFLPADVWLYSWERSDGLLVSHGNRLMPRPGPAGPFEDGPYRWSAVVNDEGFREDHPVPEGPMVGEKRLLGLGDSWMFGTSVTEGRTLPDQIEDRLEAAGWAEKVDVINAGVPSFAAFDVLWRWNELADHLALDGVILSMPHNAGHQSSSEGERALWYAAGAVSPPTDIRLYRLLRQGFDRFRRPRYADAPEGRAAGSAAADIAVLIADVRRRGLPVYLLLPATEMEGALQGKPAPLAEARHYADQGALVGWAVLPKRECWGFRDHGHPSEKGVGALSAVVAELILSGRSMAPTDPEPACVPTSGVPATGVVAP